MAVLSSVSLQCAFIWLVEKSAAHQEINRAGNASCQIISHNNRDLKEKEFTF
jgi:indole-3-glycerol phosphate synthase